LLTLRQGQNTISCVEGDLKGFGTGLSLYYKALAKFYCKEANNYNDSASEFQGNLNLAIEQIIFLQYTYMVIQNRGLCGIRVG